MSRTISVPDVTLGRIPVIATGVVLSAAAAATVPFTWQADLVTALALGLAAGAYALRLAGVHGPGRPGPSGPSGGPGDGRSGAPVVRLPSDGGAASTFDGAWPWLVVSAVLLAWELFSYASSPRRAHPTASSVADLVTRWPPGEAAVFFAWLLLGWYLVRR